MKWLDTLTYIDLNRIADKYHSDYLVGNNLSYRLICLKISRYKLIFNLFLSSFLKRI